MSQNMLWKENDKVEGEDDDDDDDDDDEKK